jgi:sigma-B regulation protein RsbU (phosphoserine phosphatase)
MAAEESISPTLRVVNGPNAGRLFPLDRDRTVIGRNPECDIVLTPKSVSRRHAAISRRGREYLIEDLGSTRGTYVGGVKLSQPAVLNDAAPIQLGDIQLMFQQAVIEIYDEEEKSTIFASIDMKTPSSRSLMEVRPAAKLRALMRINQVFGSALAMGELIDQVLTSLFEIFPRAERGFVLLLDRETGQLAPTAIRTRSGPTNDLKISKTILERVLKDGQAILSKDVMQEFPLSESLAGSTIRSIMCAPILDRSQLPIGWSRLTPGTGGGGSTRRIWTSWFRSRVKSASPCRTPNCIKTCCASESSRRS